MNRTLSILALSAFVALGVGHAHAEHGGPHDGPGGPGGHHGRFFQEADTNNDGFLTKEEMQTQQQQRMDNMFTHVDGDKDGKLSQDELKKGREEMRERMRTRFRERQGGPGANE